MFRNRCVLYSRLNAWASLTARRPDQAEELASASCARAQAFWRSSSQAQSSPVPPQDPTEASPTLDPPSDPGMVVPPSPMIPPPPELQPEPIEDVVRYLVRERRARDQQDAQAWV